MKDFNARSSAIYEEARLAKAEARRRCAADKAEINRQAALAIVEIGRRMQDKLNALLAEQRTGQAAPHRSLIMWRDGNLHYIGDALPDGATATLDMNISNAPNRNEIVAAYWASYKR